METVADLFSWAPKSLRMMTATMKLKDACSLEENLDIVLKSSDITLPTKVHLVKAVVFPVIDIAKSSDHSSWLSATHRL